LITGTASERSRFAAVFSHRFLAAPSHPFFEQYRGTASGDNQSGKMPPSPLRNAIIAVS
jgi:hypothetical protein